MSWIQVLEFNERIFIVDDNGGITQRSPRVFALKTYEVKVVDKFGQKLARSRATSYSG